MKTSLKALKGTLFHVLRLLRVHHYSKNLLVFAPAFFAQELIDMRVLYKAAMGFGAISSAASAVYILNDIFDAPMDAKHPYKSQRPLASGDVSIQAALFLLAGCVFMAVLTAQFLNSKTTLIILTYLMLGPAYTLVLKKIPILDVLAVSAFLVMRLFVGSFATSVELSGWIVLMTLLLSLFLALGKRKDDVMIYHNNRVRTRKVVGGYSRGNSYLNIFLIFIALSIICVYLLYIHTENVQERVCVPYLYLTAIFVVIGILRYLYLVFVQRDSGSPVRIFFKDRIIQCALAGWIITFGFGLYG